MGFEHMSKVDLHNKVGDVLFELRNNDSRKIERRLRELQLQQTQNISYNHRCNKLIH